VTDPQGLEHISRQILRDGRSLLQYVSEAFPYAPAEAEPARHRLEALVQEERSAIGNLIRHLLRRHETPPFLAAFPTRFTTINFVSLGHILPALVKDQELSIADLEHTLAELHESDERRLLADLLDLKRRHLQELHEVSRNVARAEAHEPSVVPAPSAAVKAAH
jgi:hypothetical protein